eukprot:COSAG04_NODE_30108_length_264_cov_1.278788_1_plen_56_part_10
MSFQSLREEQLRYRTPEDLWEVWSPAVRDVQAASGAAPKPDGGRPFILFADERLLE